MDIPKKIENKDTDTCIQIFTAALFTIPKIGKHPKDLSTDEKKCYVHIHKEVVFNHKKKK